MNTTEKTVSVYEGLAHVRGCFEALGDAGEALKRLCAAMREAVQVRQEWAAMDDRIRAAYAKAGIARTA